jgi:hypothetical protein
MVDHADDPILVQLADAELAPDEAVALQRHLEQCAGCRERYREIEQDLAGYDDFHRRVLKPALPAPPRPWAELALPRRATLPVRFLAMAAVVLLGVFTVYRLTRPAQVSAAELLTRAAAVQRPAGMKKRIRVQTGGRAFVRPAVYRGAARNDTNPEMRALFQAAHYSWDDPLSVRAYISWRSQLSDWRDEVANAGGAYIIRTTTSKGELVEATLALSTHDLQPLQSTLRFTQGRVVEIMPTEEMLLAEAPAPPPAPRQEASTSTVRVCTPSQQLRAAAALHTIEADLAEPIEVQCESGGLVVTAIGLPAARQRQLLDALSPVPGVDLRFEEPRARTTSPASSGPETGAVLASQLLTQLEVSLGGRAPLEQFVDRALDTSDSILTRAHALRSLADRFPAEAEAALSSQDQQVLHSMAAEHLRVLMGRLAEVQSQLAAGFPAVASPPRDVVVAPASWQVTVHALFAAAKGLDELLNALLAPAANQPAADVADLPDAVHLVDLQSSALAKRL